MYGNDPRGPINLSRERETNTATWVVRLFRVGIFLSFLLLVGRLYQLQIVQGTNYRVSADENRFRLEETAAPRGVIYDKTGQILVRNHPSFEVSIVPEDLPFNDPETPDVDEERAEIERILRMLQVDTDPGPAIRMGEIMFRRLGRIDFADTAEAAGVELNFVLAPGPVELVDGQEVSTPILIPDLSEPLPLEGLVALVLRLVQIKGQGSASQPIPVLDLVDPNRAFEIVEESYALPSLRVNEVPIRLYTYGDLFSHVLGFMGPIPAAVAEEYEANGYTNPNERVGLNGLEYSYQTELRGLPGYKNVEVDILGRQMRTVGQVIDPVPGSNLILNLDWRLQDVMARELAAAMEEQDAPWGVTIAMNPQTGAILGMVSLPPYDNNIFAEGINEEYLALEADERRPLINYAIGGLYPPGSTFKMVPSTAALQEKVIDKETQIRDSGPIYLPNRFFPDDLSQAQEFVSWNHALGIVHGPLNVVDALALSNDIFFYWIGGGFPPADFIGLGYRRLADWAKLFGYGEPTGIDLPGEVGGLVPDDQWKRQLYAESWTTGDSYNMAIGQGYLLSTPLQVLVSTAAVANGGKVMEPQIVYQVVDSAGGLQRDFTPKVRRELPLDDGVIEAVQEGMWTVVNADYGTATNARVPGVTVAGKTGTAEFCEYEPELEDCRRDEDDNLPTHAWFVAYAPYENPEIAVVTFVYDGGEGSEVAAPVTQKILQAYFTEINPMIDPPADEAAEETQ
ncbi:MAG: penicillin-binding protein 2 [Caldilineaceae bacterium]|nr:penicillin-binding protein 2 [Caldilineaceae bacterium]